MFNRYKGAIVDCLTDITFFKRKVRNSYSYFFLLQFAQFDQEAIKTQVSLL